MNKRDAISAAALSRVGYGYIYGATGWICTEARLAAQAKQYPAYANAIYTYGRKYWLGKICYDCAQLTRRAAKDAGYNMVSGATSQWNQDIWQQKGTIDTLPDEKAIFLFIKDKASGRMKHVAVTVGDGWEVEARGHAYGVVKRKIASCSFTHWARLKDIDGATVDVPPLTLKKGMRGEDVKRMQTLLMAADHALPRFGADGIFGAETKAAVVAFQTARGIVPDGVVGQETWAALLTSDHVEGEEGDSSDATFRVCIAGLTEDNAKEIAALYPGATIVMEGGEGA